MKTVKFAILLSALLVFPLSGQITQEHPELCAKLDGFVPLPPNVSAVVDHSIGHADLFIGSGNSTVKISLPGVVDDVDEVCPLSDGRLVLFGGTYNSANINIIDGTHALLLDSFYGFDPAMSPNQRWLVYRKFYPLHTELPVSEEYLLYDLTKTPAQDRPRGVVLYDRANVGAVIFPLGQRNLLTDNIGLPEDQQHSFRSKSFFWAPDSQAIVFGDSVQDRFSLVLVLIDSAGVPRAYVHPIPVSEECSGNKIAPKNFGLSLSHAEIGLDKNGDRSIEVTFEPSPGVCVPQALELRSADFQPAKAEVHVEPKRKGIIIDQ